MGTRPVTNYSPSMSVCPNCGSANPADEIVCQGCGLTLSGFRVTDENTRPEIARLASAQAREAIERSLRAPRHSAATIESAGMEEYDLPPPSALSTPPSRARDLQLPPPEPVHDFPVHAPSLRFGYDDESDIAIPLPQVSARHAEIARDQNRYVIRDLGSTNGTFVNGHRVEAAVIRVGDVIGLGSYEFKFGRDIVERIPAPDTRGPNTMALAAPDFLREPVVVGREIDCDIVLDAPQISRHHAEFIFTGTGWRLRDLGSANGTFVNDRSRRIDEAVVTDDDVVFFGSYRFPVTRIRDFLDTGSADVQGGTVPLPLDKPIITIGRGLDNDVVLDAPPVSRNHARLIRTDDAIYIEDLGSANGTFIDGDRISGRALLEPGRTLSFGSYAIRLDLARGHVQRSYRGDILIQAEDLQVDLSSNGSRPTRILNGVSFTAYPTEFVGLLGPSGAGKTTLLMALIGYLKPTRGRTLVNGDDLAHAYDRYRGAVGYVPQEDIIHGELTVYEALYYTAKLRLPPDTDDREIDRRIRQVLDDLEIAETRDIQIGTADQKGISGGQRKRVNLALELLTEPSLLCLDEPTSGLASEDALNVMRLLRKLADGGRTILLTVHQPSLQAYRLMDNVLYLADGEEVYYGPTYPDSLLFFHPDVRPNTPEAARVLADPGSIMEQVMEAKRAGEPMETLAARYRQSRYFAEYVDERRKNRSAVRVTKPSERKRPRFSVQQWLTLCRRYFTIRMKDRIGMSVLLVQAPVIAILLDLVFVSESSGALSRMEYTPYALFLLVVSAIWFGCSNAAREIVSEQAIYRRERMVNLSISAYVLSKFAVLGALCLLQCLVLLSATYLVLDFWGNPLFHLAILWLSSLAGVGMGLLLSAVVRTTEAAMATVPLLLIPQIILGGAIMPVDRMSEPVWVASHAVMSRWAFEGMLQTEHLSDAYELSVDDLPRAAAPGLPPPPPPPNPLDRFFGDSETWLAVDVAVLSAFLFVFLVAVAAALRRRER